MAFSTVLFPKFSHAFFSDNKESLTESIKNSLSINTLIFVPVVLIFIFFGDIITKLFYQRGEFNANDTLVTFNILRIYAFSLIFYSAYSVINKLLYGINAVKFLAVISIIGLSTKILLSFVLVNNFKQNGLAISTAVSYTLIFLLAFAGSVRKMKMSKFLMFSESFFLLINGMFGFLTVKILFNLFNVKSDLFEVWEIICFIFIYIFNLGIVKHKSYLIFRDTFNSWKFSFLNKSKE